MAKKRRALHPDEPLRHPDHPRPVTRRDFLRQGFITGGGAVVGTSLFSVLAPYRNAYAGLSSDLNALKSVPCNISTLGAGKIPFICFDLAGGANFAGSNVIVGGPGGQEDLLTPSGYNKLGLPGDMLPDFAGNLFVNRDLGIAFHSDSAMLKGIQSKFTNTTNVNGAVIPARSDNDTANNPHNPMYGINRAGSRGELLTLIGSRNSDSGGNSMSPTDMINLSVRPTKIDRPSDVSGLVDTGQLVQNMGLRNAVRVMEAIERISDAKLGRVTTNPAGSPNPTNPPSSVDDAALKEKMQCEYVKSADLVDRYGTPGSLNANPSGDSNIPFTQAEVDSTREFATAAAVMKLVVNGYAGAGTITMGGYDYHTGDRTTGEARDFRAGQCIGACLRYAELLNTPLMIYVFSDGSVASNGRPDPGEPSQKLEWTGDNSSTACAFFLVYNPVARPQLSTDGGTTALQHQQLGWFRPDASVETAATPAANNVNLLVETLILNYMALHNQRDMFPTSGFFPSHGLGNSTSLQKLAAFNPICDGDINNML